MVLELAIDNSLIRNLESENKTLRLKLEEAEKRKSIGRVEIVDNRTSKEVKFGGF